mgnify:CR=1 FL=1
MELIDLTNNISQTKLQEINNYLKEGKLIIFPTETVYGLGAIATDDKAVKKIYIAKGRKSDNPLIVHLSSVSEIEKYAHIENEIERKLINTFMPGPANNIDLYINARTIYHNTKKEKQYPKCRIRRPRYSRNKSTIK